MFGHGTQELIATSYWLWHTGAQQLSEISIIRFQVGYDSD